MNEAQAIKLCIEQRDSKGFDYLAMSYSKQAYCHAFGILGNHEDATDACQDAFRKAFLSIPTLERLDRFYPWFYCILRNHCFNQLSRKKTIQKSQSLLETDSEQSPDTSPRQEMENAEERDSVQAALSLLKPEFREILILKYFSDFNYQQISETLGIPRGTVMSRLYHARTAFKNAVESIDQ